MLYSIGSSESNASAFSQIEDILAHMSEVFGDIESDPIADPTFQTIQICSVMHCTQVIWKFINVAEDSIRGELLDQVLSQTEDWSATFGGDYGNIVAASFALTIDDSETWPGVSTIYNTIIEGQENHLFESEDNKLVCLAMIAGKLSRTADARVTGLIDIIGAAAADGRGQSCFGVFFGLGIIASNLLIGTISGTDPSDVWRRQQVERILVILLSAFNACLVQENDAIHCLIEAIKGRQTPDDLSQSCANLDTILIQDGSIQKMKAILIGLSHSIPAISDKLTMNFLTIIDKLPWGSGKSFALHSAYKNGLDSGILEQKDLVAAIATSLGYCSLEEPNAGAGDALLALALLSGLSAENAQRERELVVTTLRNIFIEKNVGVRGEDSLMSILAGCAALGDLPGISSFTSNIASVKKKTVADIVKLLKEILGDTEELKYKDASTICLGILSSWHMHSQMRKNKDMGRGDYDRVQAKDGSVMQEILTEVEKSYSLLSTATSRNSASRAMVVTKLCALFSMLEPIAMPGKFSRAIEVTLNDSLGDEAELKRSATKLLISQLEPGHRRIGFDGRGFLDLTSRLVLTKTTPNDATPILMKSLPNLISKIPTSTGEDLVKSMWAFCQADLSLSFSSQSTKEFLVGLKSILVSVTREGTSKLIISPALIKAIQKFIANGIFSDLCAYAVPSVQNTAETVWISFFQCLQLVPSTIVAEADYSKCSITPAAIFGVAICASLSMKTTRKVESWIAVQEATSVKNLLSVLAIAAQMRNESEMKESILSIFDIMLVKKGPSIMSLYLIAAKVAFWWETQQMCQLQYLEAPTQYVSSMSSFFVTRNLSFRVHALPHDVLLHLFSLFVDDLPPKLAVLCKMWNISDDVSNRALRIGNAHIQEKRNSVDHTRGPLSCIREIAYLINRGETQ